MSSSTKKARVTDNRLREGIAKRLFDLRLDTKNNGLSAITQEEAAEKLSLLLNGDGKFISSKRVSDWEGGLKEPYIDDIVGLAKIFDTTCDFLLTGVEPERVDASRRYGLSNEALRTLEELFSPMNLSALVERNSYFYSKPVEFINIFLTHPQIQYFAAEAIHYAWYENLIQSNEDATKDCSANIERDMKKNSSDWSTINRIMEKNPDLRNKRVVDEHQYQLSVEYQLNNSWKEILSDTLSNPALIANGVVYIQTLHPEWLGLNPDEEAHK